MLLDLSLETKVKAGMSGRELSQIIENFTDERKINTFRVMVRGVSCGKFQRALEANPFNHDDPMNKFQHVLMMMNSLYIDEDQEDHEYEQFLEIKQFSHETVCAYIDRFEERKLQAEDLGLPQNDIITKDLP
jgi:hypothetical protein